MSDFDVDIRAVSSASFGARLVASDVSQAASADQTNSTQSSGAQASAVAPETTGQVATSGAQPQFRYDSFRFIYRSDYGRIVLVDQNPETGKAVSQIPSQRALQLYAEQHQAELRASVSSPVGGGQTSSGLDSRGAGIGTSKNAGAAGHAAPSSTAPTAPNLAAVLTPSPAYLAQAFPPVNITI